MARDEKMSKRVAMRIGEQAMDNVIEGISLFFINYYKGICRAHKWDSMDSCHSDETGDETVGSRTIDVSAGSGYSANITAQDA